MEGDRIGKVSLVLDIATCKGPGTSIAYATGLQISVCQIFALHSIEKGSRSYHCTNEAPPFHQEKFVFLLHRKYPNNIQAFPTKDAGIQNLMEAWTCGHWWQCSERLFNHFGLILSKLQSCLALEKMLDLSSGYICEMNICGGEMPKIVFVPSDISFLTRSPLKTKILLQ
jgi:hypothetical protein